MAELRTPAKSDSGPVALVREHYRVECELNDPVMGTYRSHVGILLEALDAIEFPAEDRDSLTTQWSVRVTDSAGNVVVQYDATDSESHARRFLEVWAEEEPEYHAELLTRKVSPWK